MSGEENIFKCKSLFPTSKRKSSLTDICGESNDLTLPQDIVERIKAAIVKLEENMTT